MQPPLGCRLQRMGLQAWCDGRASPPMRLKLSCISLQPRQKRGAAAIAPLASVTSAASRPMRDLVRGVITR